MRCNMRHAMALTRKIARDTGLAPVEPVPFVHKYPCELTLVKLARGWFELRETIELPRK